MLLLGAGRQVGDQVVLLGRRGQDFAVTRIDDERLGGLGAAVDADEERFHGHGLKQLTAKGKSKSQGHAQSAYPCGCPWCQRHADATICSSFGYLGSHPRSRRALSAAATSRAGSP